LLQGQLLGLQPFEAQLKEQGPVASAQVQQAPQRRAREVQSAARQEAQRVAQQEARAERLAALRLVAWVHLEVASQEPAAPALQAEMRRVRLDNNRTVALDQRAVATVLDRRQRAAGAHQALPAA
jgi:hypothetical protein